MTEKEKTNPENKNLPSKKEESEKITNPEKKYFIQNILGEKTCIGIISSHDDREKNNKLVALLEEFLRLEDNILKNFTLIFTGGTYDRIIAGATDEEEKDRPYRPIKKAYYENLICNCGVIRLSKRSEGGVTLLSDLIVKHCISVLWFFLSPRTHHWLIPENLALIRLCDQWSVKKLMTWGSILEWIKHAKNDQKLNSIDIDKEFLQSNVSEKGDLLSYTHKKRKEFTDNYKKMNPHQDWEEIELKLHLDPTISLENWAHGRIYHNTIALIAHDAMKAKMTEFAIYYEKELKQFNRIITTSTTGKEILDAVPLLRDKIVRFHSGTKGGDIEISAEILKGRCKIVVFFIDPLTPHPHIDDIRTVFSVCMIHDDIIMLTNEVWAREWFEARLKDRRSIP